MAPDAEHPQMGDTAERYHQKETPFTTDNSG